MLNVNSYNVKYRVFVCVAHKLIPFHKTRRSQSPPGARPHAGTSSHGSGQRPIRCPFHTTAASPCLALPCPALPRCALPRLAQPCRALPRLSGVFRLRYSPRTARAVWNQNLLPAYHLKLSEHAAKRAETNGYAAFNEQVLDFLFLDFLVWENG